MRILIYGLAKSGTTVLHLRIKEAMEKKFNATVVEVFEPITREGDTCLKKDGSKFELGQYSLVKALMPTAVGNGATPESVLNDYTDFDKKIFINRDPRDRWISGFFYRWFHRHNPNQEEFERALRLTKMKEEHPHDLPFYSLFSTSIVRNEAWKKRQEDQLKGVDQFIDAAKSKDWFILKYEDFMDGKTEELSDYLGLAVSLEESKDNRFAHVARSKGHGNWRRWFTSEDVEFYQPLYQWFLDKHGYGDDWKLDGSPHLHASEGSEYMSNLFHGKRSKGHHKKRFRLFR